MIDAAILDMDGLLIDTEPFWQETERQVMKKYGFIFTPEMQQHTFGLRTDEQIKYWYQRNPWPEPDFDRMVEEYETIMLGFYRNNAELMDGAEYIIRFFTDRKMPLALASSSPMLLINAFVDSFGLRKYFDKLISAEYEEFGKPHPAVYISTAKSLGKNPSSCLAFEDSFNGLLAAKSAKMKAVIIPDHRTIDTGKYEIADLRLSSLSEFGEKELQIIMQ